MSLTCNNCGGSLPDSCGVFICERCDGMFCDGCFDEKLPYCKFCTTVTEELEHQNKVQQEVEDEQEDEEGR